MRFLRGGWPVLLAAAASGCIFALGFVVSGSYIGAWHFLGIHSLYPAFADLRTVTHSIDCTERGLDPYTTSVCDPWGRLFNYPSLWLHLGFLGINSHSSNFIGIALIFLLLISFRQIYTTTSAFSAGITVVAVVSPPVLLAVERGNIDIIMFSAIVLTIFAMAKISNVYITFVLGVIISLLAILKIYPIAAVAAIARRRFGVAGIIFTVTATALGIFKVIGVAEISTIAKNTPQSMALSYGDMPIFLMIRDRFSGLAGLEVGTLRILATASALVVVLIAFIVSMRSPGFLRSILPGLDCYAPHGAVSLACLSVFCFSFVLGSNYDYRLIFIVGALPVLLLYHDRMRGVRTMGAPVAVVVFLWLSRVSMHFPFLFEFLDWSLFAICTLWISQSLFSTKGVAAPRPVEGCMA